MYEAIRALEQVGVLSWVNRIKRVREYVPRPVRQPGARRCAEPGRRQCFQSLGALARLADKAASAARGRFKPREPRRPQPEATTLRGSASFAISPGR